jgi:mRNA interferase RelE/StbE
MMKFTVLVHKKALKKLEKLSDEDTKDRLKEAFKLMSDPYSLDTIKISGEENVYRTRIGKYRILFIKEGDMLYITDFDTRGKIYKN